MRNNILNIMGLTIDEFIKESKESSSAMEIARKYKVSDRPIRNLMDKYNCWPIKTSFKKTKLKYNFEKILKGEILLENPNNKSKNYILKKYLFDNNIKDKICEICSLKKWNNKPISLELDHMDGNRNNNKLNNLRILCPNCHSQTETYRGKNIKK